MCLGNIAISRALHDLRASVSLLIIFAKDFKWGTSNPPNLNSIRGSLGKVFDRDFLKMCSFKWKKFFIHCDFVVMEMEEDVKNRKLSLQIGEEKLEFKLT